MNNNDNFGLFINNQDKRALEQMYKKGTSLGGMKSNLTRSLYSIDPLGGKPALENNKNNRGFVFFTRPLLNLTTMNLRGDTKLYNLLTNKNVSLPSYIRNTLDPRLEYNKLTSAKSILAQPTNPFISFLTNSVRTMSGGQDEVLPTFTSNEGKIKEQYIQADGLVDYNNAYDLDITFRNTQQNLGVFMFSTWIRYMSNVFMNRMKPYTDVLLENEIDYMTRIYRIVLDKEKKYVTYIGATGVSMPMTAPMGQLFDYSDESIYADFNKDYTIRFKSIGMLHNEKILIKEFNETIAIFNPSFRYKDIDSMFDMTKIPKDFLHKFRDAVIPYINEETLELEWYAKTEVVNNWLDFEEKQREYELKKIKEEEEKMREELLNGQ